MVLDELHVAQRHAVTIGERHAVAGDDAAVGVLAEHPPRAAGRDDHRLRLDQRELAGADLDRQHALAAAVLDDQVGAEVLIEALDRRILDRGLEQRVQHVEAGLVGGEPGTLDLHAAERAHVDVAVVLAAPRAAPVLELHHLLDAMGDEVVDDVLLAQPVAAGHRVVEMMLQAVVRLRDRRGAALGRHRVAAHRVDLGDQRHDQRRVGLGHRDRGPQACTAGTHDRHIGFENVHPGLRLEAASGLARASDIAHRSTSASPSKSAAGVAE